MAIFKAEAKNKVNVEKKPRVYFTCHPEDFERYFKKVCDDIFKTHDCAIYYTEDMTEALSEDEKETGLYRSNLFVVPVTLKLLTTPSRAMDEDIPFALKHNISVLPIMMENGLTSLYSDPGKFGELQYLNPLSTDTTEVSYEEKLRKHLESVLISDEMARRVRRAFDAYIFLSYRKKDRRYANELMRLIHSVPECRDIAIWFDEFLTPGESFRENIENIMDDCNLFALLVTPRLLEKVVDENGTQHDNFVISTELPLARTKKEKKGTDIFAVEMERTDEDALSAIDIRDYVSSDDEAFRSRLLDSVTKIAVTRDQSPEHDFCIGLAYLEGIDVEINCGLAIELISSAADRGLSEAMYKLFTVYFEGIRVAVDYRKATYWAEKYAEYMVAEYGEEHEATITAINNLAYVYSEIDEHEKALLLYKKAYNLSCKVRGRENPDTFGMLNNIGTGYFNAGNYPEAQKAFEEVYDIACRTDGEKSPHALRAMNNIAVVCMKTGDYTKALLLLDKVHLIRCDVLGETHPETLNALCNLADAHSDCRDYETALELYEEAYELCCETLGKGNPQTYTTLNNMANCYCRLHRAEEALEIFEDVYSYQCRTRGDGCSLAIMTLNNIGDAYTELKDYENAERCFLKAYNRGRQTLGEEDEAVLSVLNNLAVNYFRMGCLEKSLYYMEKVYPFLFSKLGEKHPRTYTAMNSFALFCIHAQDFRKAAELLEKAEKLSWDLAEETGIDPFEIFNNLAHCYSCMGEFGKAVNVFENAYNKACRETGERSPMALILLNNLATAYIRLSDYETAMSLFRKSYDICCSISAQESDTGITALNGIAFCHKENGNLKEALSIYEKIYPLAVRVWGENNPNTVKTAQRVAELRATCR